MMDGDADDDDMLLAVMDGDGDDDNIPAGDGDDGAVAVDDDRDMDDHHASREACEERLQ